jgi:hypothetical protein
MAILANGQEGIDAPRIVFANHLLSGAKQGAKGRRKTGNSLRKATQTSLTEQRNFFLSSPRSQFSCLSLWLKPFS